MERLWRLWPWLARGLLLAVTVLFTLIGLRYLSDPVGKAAADGIVLGSVTAVSRLRVAFSAFPLGFAAILFGCLISTRRLLLGLVALATLIGVVTAIRGLGILVDGSAGEALKLLRVEFAVLTLSLLCIFVELARRRAAQSMPASGKSQASLRGAT